ncbi:MAG: T9SS type A sorting domain-containing protein [Bacteroidota bacterium]
MSKFTSRLVLLLLICTAGTFTSFGQLTGLRTIPGNYATLDLAITDLNTQGVGPGGVLFQVLPGNPQTAPAGGYAITASGSAASPIVFIGNNNTITASNAHVVGNINDAIIKIVGGDFIGITGFTMQENAANTNNVSGTNNMTEWGIAFLYASTSNGAQSNLVQGCTISLNRTYTNTWGIYSNTRHTATAVSTTADIVSPAGSNSFNRIYGCNISNVNMGIAFIGSNAAANQDIGNDVGGSAVSEGNILTNWGGALAAGTYISNSGTSYGIFMNHQVNYNVSYNTLTSATVTPTVTFRGIVQDFTATAPTGTIGDTISNNTITMTSGQTSGTFRGIDAISGNTTTTLFITNNTILNSSITGVASTSLWGGIFNSGAVGTLHITGNILQGGTSTSTSGGFTGISNTGAVVNTVNITNNQVGNALGGAISFSAAQGSAVTGITNTGGAAASVVNITGNNIQGITHTVAGSSAHTYIANTATNPNTNINNNTFTNLIVNTTGSVTIIGNNVTHVPGTIHNVNNNSIVTGYSKTGAGGTVLFYNSFSTSLTGVSETNTGNNFSNMTFTGATTINGWRCGDGSTTAPYGPNKTVTNNTFSNITGGTAALQILEVDYSNSAVNTHNVSGNVISNISGGGAVTGIVSAQGNQNYFNNTISGLTSTGGSLVRGMAITGGATQQILKNKIYDISVNNAAGTVNGINITGGVTTNISNNLIGDLRAPASSGANMVIGINLTGGTTVNVYYNTIQMNASSSGTDFGSSGISTATSVGLTLNNNIFTNTSTPNGTGFTVAYRRSSATIGSYNATSDNNLFYAGTPDATHLIMLDGTTGHQTLAAYQAAIAPIDDASISIVPSFLSTSGVSANFLHIDPNVVSTIESGGANIAGITDDFDGNIRQGNGGYTGTGIRPDIGADEFDQIPAPCTAIDAGTISASDVTVCDGDDVLFSTSGETTGTAGLSLQWQVSGTAGGPYTNVAGGTGATTNSYNTAALTPGTYFYVLQATCSYGPATDLSNEIQVTVGALPVIGFNASPNDTICDGSAVTLSGTGAVSYVWTGGITDGVAFTPVSSGSYTVTGTDALGCEGTAIADIELLSLPTVSYTALPNDTICEGTAVTLSGSGAISYSWTGGITDGVAFTPVTSGSYTVSGTDAEGCVGTAIADIEVISAPTVSYSVSPNDTICAGTAVTLSGSGADSYSWTGGVTDGVAFTPASTATYTLTGTLSGGCSADVNVEVVVLSLPSVTLSGNTNLCPSSSTLLTGTSGGSSQWYLNGSPIGGATSNTYMAVAPGVYNMIKTNTNGCADSAATGLTVVLLAAPTVGFTVSPNDSICPGETVILSGTGAVSYSWTGGITNGVGFQPAVSGSYTVTGTDGNSCTNTAVAAITVGTTPTVNLGADISQPNPPAVLDAGAGFSSYDWSTSAVTQTISVSVSGEYSVTVTNAFGCEDSDTIQVEFTNSVVDLGNGTSLVLYPNPNNGLFNVQIENLVTNDLLMEIVDQTGRTIQTQLVAAVNGSHTQAFDVSQLQTGVYTVRLTSNGKTSLARFVLNR